MCSSNQNDCERCRCPRRVKVSLSLALPYRAIEKKPDGDSVPVVVHWEEVPLRASCLAWRAAFFSFLFSSLSCFLDVSAIAVTFGVCVGEVRKPIPSA